MSCLIVAGFKQRLVQVCKCLVSGRRFRTLSNMAALAQPQPKQRCNHQSFVNMPCVLNVRLIHTVVAGPLTTRALVRYSQKPKYPDDEYRELVEEASGINEKMQDIKYTSDRPLITVPVHLARRWSRKVEIESRDKAVRQRIVEDSRKGNQSKIIIHCKRNNFNHYHSQSYPSGSDIPLASGNWAHRKSAEDFFTLFPGLKRQSEFYMTGSESMTFKDLGISQALCDNMASMGINRPTHIQVFAIPQLLKGGYNLVAAETGCGKTLAYLLPAIHQILENKRYRIRQKPGEPTTVILVPSRELADQIFNVAIRLCSKLDITVKLVQGGALKSKLNNPPTVNTVDILIATTNALKVLTSAGVYGLGRIFHVILDEADTLLDDSFFPELVGPFLNFLPWKDVQRQLQLTLVSATMPKNIKQSLGQVVRTEDFYHCTTPALHYSMPHVPQKFLRLRKGKKPEVLKQLVEADVKNEVPVLIFCNKAKTCDWLSHYLNGLGFDSVSAHGRMPMKYRRGRVEVYQSGKINILIATDLASRGIDTVRTQHVINYEFPLFIADYIHRCGRTGRVGSSKGCHVTNFISRLGEIATVQKIELSVRREKALPDVNANIKGMYEQHYGSFKEIKPLENDDEEISAMRFSRGDDDNGNSDEVHENDRESEEYRTSR